MRAITGLRPNIAAWSEAPEGSEYLSESFASLGDASVPEEREIEDDATRGADGKTNDDDASGSGGGGGASAGSGGASAGSGTASPAQTASPLHSAVTAALSANLELAGAGAGPGGPQRSGSPAPKPARLSGTNERDAKTLWIGRAAELAPLFENGDVLESLAAIETPTTKPGVFFLSGSSGVAGDTLRYLRMLASMGHLVMCPDDFCGWPERLRHRRPAVLRPEDPANYWTNNLLYAKDSFATGELVYESCAEKYTSSNRLSVVYDATLKAKHAAMTSALFRLPDSMRRRGMFLAGNSEGAIVLGMMDDGLLELDSTLGSPRADDTDADGDDPAFDPARTSQGRREPARLLGRINIAYSLEPNYFTYRTLNKSQGLLAGAMGGGDSGGSGKLGSFGAIFESDASDASHSGHHSSGSHSSRAPAVEPRGLFGSAWRVDVPTLCVNGSEDQFFGRRSSVSSAILQRAREQEERDEAEANGNKNMEKNMETWRRGERPNITGDAGQRMIELGMTRAFVAQMEGGRHAMCDTHDLALYRLLAEFLAKPEECASIAERWAEDEQMKEYVLWRAQIVKEKSAFAAMASSDEVAWRRSERKEGSGRGGSRRRGRLFHPSASSFLDLTSSFASLVTAQQRTTPPSSPGTGGSLADLAAASSEREAPVKPNPRRFSVDVPGMGVPPSAAATGPWGSTTRNGRKTLGLFDDRSDVVPKPDNPRKISVDDDGTFRRMPSPLPPRAMPSPPPSPPRAMPKASKKSSSSKNCCVM